MSGQTPVGLAVDGENVYWANSTSGGTVMRTPLAGGPSVTVAAGQSNVADIAVDAMNVYWTTNSMVVSATKDGGGAAVTIASDLAAANGIAVDSANVYWTEAAAVVRKPLQGGPAITLASDEVPTFLAVGTAGVYWATGQVTSCMTDLSDSGAVVRASLTSQ